jgi:hypothetical protein
VKYQVGCRRFKKISVCNLFYRVTLDIIGPLLHTKEGSKYILIAIDHYFKWCEAKVVSNHTSRHNFGKIYHL